MVQEERPSPFQRELLSWWPWWQPLMNSGHLKNEYALPSRRKKKSQPVPSPRISLYAHWLLVALRHELNYLQLGLSSRRRLVVSSSFPIYPIHLTFLVVNQYELQSPIKQILWIKLDGKIYHGNLPPTSFFRLRSPPSAVLPLHPF